MISYAKSFHKQSLMNIWKNAFPNDSDAFVNFYFENKYSEKNTLLFFKKSKIASCLQMLPYKMTYYKHFINTSYISGAATHSQHRSKGFMSQLLIHALEEMKKRGNVITTLIPQEPWLIDFYKRFGYTPCFEYQSTTIKPDDYPHFPDEMVFKPLELADLHPAYLLYQNHFMRQNTCIQKSITDFLIMVQACQKFDENVYVLINNGETVGVCFCFLSDGKVILKDCITKNANYRQYFLSKLIENSSKNGATRWEELNGVMGMARILDVHKLLTLFAKSNLQAKFTVKINDQYIAENNLTLAVSHGKISRVTCDFPTVDFDLSIQKLTRLLLGYQTEILGEKYAVFPQQHPYMSLMLE